MRRLGINGPEVSVIGLGCMGMSMGYGPSNDSESIQTLHRAIDLGVTFIDTANIYGEGHNEILIGKAIKHKRNKLILATKMGLVKGSNGIGLDFYPDGSPAQVKKACDESLKRLNVDTIDLYYLHRVDPNVPIEDTIGAMADLVKLGKINYIGISEAKPLTIRRAASVHHITAVQTEYSLWERYPEDEILPTCNELGISFVAYSPLGRGFLTGKLLKTETLSNDDFRRVLPRFIGDNFTENQKLITRFKEWSVTKNCTMAQLALAWLIAKNDNVIPIPGTKKLAYLEENLGALTVQLSNDDLIEIDKIFPKNIAKGKKYPDSFDGEL